MSFLLPGRIFNLPGRFFYSQRRGGSVEPRRELGPGLGGYTIRPYRETESGFVGAACMAARAAPPRRMHLRRTHRPKPGTAFTGPVVHVPGPGGMWACRPTPKAVIQVPCTRVANGRAMRAPTAEEPSCPAASRNPVRAAMQAAPTGKPGARFSFGVFYGWEAVTV